MMRLPIGIQHFEEIRSKGFLYVDKTQLLHELIESGKYFFLSRPRRFGKSLMVSTLRAIFEGKSELFEGLWIADHHDFAHTCPVIHLEFNNLDHQAMGLQQALARRIDQVAEGFGIALEEDLPASWKLDKFVRSLAKDGRQVVILIDEYDKPIIDHLDNPGKAKRQRDLLKAFYGVLKPLDPYLRLVLLTGVSKFSRMSIFSELNNLYDLSLDPHFAALAGLTEAEVLQYFRPQLEAIAERKGMDFPAFFGKVQQWYNGYSWDGLTRVYNPFSLLSFLQAGEFSNFWFLTGAPAFLMKLLDKELDFEFDRLQVDSLTLEGGYELSHILPEVLLFQTGYLTIAARDEDIMVLDYPNREVKDALLRHILSEYSHLKLSQAAPTVRKLVQSLESGDVGGFVEQLDGLFAQIPGQIFMSRAEAYYHSITYITLHLLGFHVRCEVQNHRGRLDAVVETADRVFVMEFKVGATAAQAIAQIRERGYARPYASMGKAVLLVGISFDPKRKGVGSYREEAL